MTRRMIAELYTAPVRTPPRSTSAPSAPSTPSASEESPAPSAAPRPIGPYERRLAAVKPWDPRVVDVAARVVEIVNRARPELVIEHIGSTAVPGLPGKGIVDLGTEADPAEIPAITAALYELGFGPQPGPNPWPATRPMLVGSIQHDGEEFR